MLFGSKTEDNIVKNLGNGAILQVVRVLLCVDLLFTIPMLMAAGREVVEESLMKTSFVRQYGERSRNVIRLTLLALVLAATYGVVSGHSKDAFGNVVTLVGAVACFSCGFIVPPLLHLQNHGWLKLGWASVTFHLFITVLGIVGMVTGVYFTLA